MAHQLTAAHPDALQQIAETKLVLKGWTQPAPLPQMSASVEDLTLHNVSLSGPVVLHEGLKKLTLDNVSTETPFIQWVYPSTLEQVEVNMSGTPPTPLDLRSVTAPRVKLTHVANSEKTVNGPLLPQGLRELEVDGGLGHEGFRIAFPKVTDSIDPEDYRTKSMVKQRRRFANDGSRGNIKIFLLPPNLETLKLNWVDYLWTEGEFQTETIRNLSITAAYEIPNVAKVFPNAETLTIGKNGYNFRYSDAAHPNVKTLTIDSVRTRNIMYGIDVRFPNLDNLTIISSYPDSKFNLGRETAPINMTLVDCDVFPRIVDFEPEYVEDEEESNEELEAEEGSEESSEESSEEPSEEPSEEEDPAEKPIDWERLEYLTMTNSNAVVPFIPHLNDLIVDAPVVTNGIRVSDILDYREAWGVPSQKKSARMSSY